jgi:signal transduction histidine kinase
MSKRSLLGLLAVAVVLPLPALGQSSGELGLPFMTSYTSHDLGAVASGWAIAEDSRGVIFVGLNNGLAEFDGQSWRYMETDDQDFFRSFALGRDGVLYTGAVGEIGYLAPDSLGNTRYVSMIDRVPEEYRDFDDVWHVFARDDGIYFYTAVSIIRWTGSRMQVWPGSFHVGGLVNGELYVREWGEGLKKLEGDSLRLVPGGDRFTDERIYVMVSYDDERMLVGTRTMGMFLFDGKTFEPFRTEADQFLRDNQIYLPGLRLQDGTFVIGTLAGGLVHMDHDGHVIRIIDRSAGLGDNTVTYLYQDSGGDLWLALNNGITRVEIESPLTIFDERRGINAAVQTFARHEGDLYAGSLAGILRLNPQTSRFELVRGQVIPSLSLLSMRDVLLNAAMTSGVSQYRRGTQSIVKDAFGNEYVGESVKRAHADSNIVFVGLRTGLGVLYYQGFGRWIDLGSTDDFGDAFQIEVTPDDAVWAASADGLFRITIPWEDGRLVVDHAEITNFVEDRGMPTGGYDVALLEDKVIAIHDEQIFRFDPATDGFVEATGFPQAHLRTNAEIAESADGQVAYAYLGNETFIGRHQPDGSFEWDSGPFQRLQRDLVNDIHLDDDGIVWLSRLDGVVRYDPEAMNSTDEEVYPTLIRKVIIGEDSVVFAGWLDPSRMTAPVLAHNENAVQFQYSLPGSEPDLTSHRTFLEGFDQDWSSWSNTTGRSYTNLPPGKYTFRAASRSAYGTESPEASFSFEIRPPWYMTLWAYGAYAFLFVLGVFTVDRVQRRRLTRKERAEAERREMELRAEAAESNARALEAENERQKNVELLSEIGRDITGTLSVEGIIDKAYENVNALMDASVFSIGILNEAEHRLDFPATREKGESLEPYDLDLSDENRLAVHCFNNNVEVVVTDWARDYRKYVEKRTAPVAGEDPASIIYLPLVHNEKKIGVITAQSFERGAYDEYHLNVLRNLATYTAIALDNAEAYNRLNTTVADLNKAMSDLSTTQEQLVTQEKMASLGQLTAGIAHEIKNPLNFVNNFAELNSELANEVADLFERHRSDMPSDLLEDLLPMLTSLSVNAQQIHKHGKRADSIIRNMMQHASGGKSERFPVEVNPFIDEYVSLSYHGMRAQVPGLNVSIKRDFDRHAGNVEMAPQEIGRVIMNLVNNALYAVHEKASNSSGSYEPTVTVSTQRKGSNVEISIEDNGPGIPPNIREKIFEPLFTTKPTGSGTGLGLSLSFDIVANKHGGSLSVESEEGSGSKFIVTLPT